MMNVQIWAECGALRKASPSKEIHCDERARRWGIMGNKCFQQEC